MPITGGGCDTCWIYHARSGLDGQTRATVATSISAAELARLRRSLNMTLRVVIDDTGKRGLTVEWCRRGRSGITLWDDSGSFCGMPERIEAACYDGLSTDAEKGYSNVIFWPSRGDCLGLRAGCFRDAVHAKNAHAHLKHGKCLPPRRLCGRCG